MCWYSADHASEILQAEAGQRLGIRKVHGSSWVVRESDLHKQRPCPVCMIDRTKVLFRFSEVQQVTLHVEAEVEAEFRMLTRPKRDSFQLSNGRELTVNALPADLIFDVLEIPGKGGLSSALREEPVEVQEPELVEAGGGTGFRPFLQRVLAFF